MGCGITAQKQCGKWSQWTLSTTCGKHPIVTFKFVWFCAGLWALPFYNSSIINILKVKDQTLDTNIPNKSLINQRHDMGPVCLTGFRSFVQLDYLGSWYLYFCVDHLETGLWLLAWFHKIPFCPCRMFTQALSRPVKGGLQHNTTYHPGRHVQACKFKPYQAALRCTNIKTMYHTSNTWFPRSSITLLNYICLSSWFRNIGQSDSKIGQSHTFTLGKP